MFEKNQQKEENLPFSPRVGCMISFVLIAIPVCLLIAVGALAARNELALNLGPVREARLWLVRKGPEQGIGFSFMGKESGTQPLGRVCYETKVHFLLWSSLQLQRQASYCDCYVLEGMDWELVGACP